MPTNMTSLLSGRIAPLVVVSLTVIALAGCRGSTSTAPPVHVNPNMDIQFKVDPQEQSRFFADGRGMRPPVVGTVARGFLREDTRYYYGRDESGALVDRLPVELTRDLLERGRDRYEIFCAVCHGTAGDGQGIIMTGGYGYVAAPTYHSDALRAQPDGHFFDVITYGVRTMPGYAQQVPVADRWAITAYIRALQRSQYASAADVPPGTLTNTQTGTAQ